MKHLLMDPAFPDIVGEWARRLPDSRLGTCPFANDNGEAEGEAADEFSDPFLEAALRLEVAATRLW